MLSSAVPSHPARFHVRPQAHVALEAETELTVPGGQELSAGGRCLSLAIDAELFPLDREGAAGAKAQGFPSRLGTLPGVGPSAVPLSAGVPGLRKGQRMT